MSRPDRPTAVRGANSIMFKKIIAAFIALAFAGVGVTATATMASAWTQSDYNLTSMCKPDAEHGSLRLRATVADGQGSPVHYVL